MTHSFPKKRHYNQSFTDGTDTLSFTRARARTHTLAHSHLKHDLNIEFSFGGGAGGAGEVRVCVQRVKKSLPDA